MEQEIFYRTVKVDGLSLFYREAGPKEKYDLSFDLGEPERYRKDVPNAEVYLLDAGHFALDTKAEEIAALVREFMRAQK